MKLINKQTTAVLITSLVVITANILSGCSIIQPAKPESMTTYALDVQFESAKSETGEKIILVNTPTAQPGFNSSQMIYIKKQHEINYFSQNKWIDSPARMLTPLLTQVLERRAKYSAVVQTRSAAMADVRLDTEILRMQHEFLTSPSQVHLTIRAQLVDMREKKVLATREFDVIETAPSDNPYGGVIATNRAVKIILLQIADFCAQESNAAKKNSNAK